MLKIGSAQVIVVGFRRIPQPPKDVEGCETIDLGQTRDGYLVERIGSVASVVWRLDRLQRLLSGCQVVLARNLEMLFLATKARRRYAPNAALVFECLDIHRLLLGGNLPSRLLRWIETRLINDVDLIVTSSPRFISEYFKPRNFNPPIKILENKVLFPDYATGRPNVRMGSSGPPWKIGWFGMIRCQRSLEILKAVAREAAGDLQVTIAGRPSPKEFPDFKSVLAGETHIKFVGSYRFDQLQALYGDVHFGWAVDYFEKGLNSSWLLPNRIYESCFFGAVPIALESVETARWLAEKQIGVTLVGRPETSLRNLLRAMTGERYSELLQALQNVPLTALAETAESCRQLVGSLENLKISNCTGY
jgi:hypothetical protein